MRVVQRSITKEEKMRYAKTMSELADVREGFSKKEIKMAIGVASDPRYKQGNYSGAVRAIEKIKRDCQHTHRLLCSKKTERGDI